MLTLRRSADRGTTRLAWLDSRHTFSFGGYHDPRHMGYRSLRVINDDRVAPGGGFGTHGHRDMEIVTYVLEGALEHRDSLGTGSVIRPGEVQKMSAGTGIEHSEFNHSRTVPVHFLQIWILPARGGMPPSYQQLAFPREARVARLCLVASGEPHEGTIHLHQDAHIYAAILEDSDIVHHEIAGNRHAWLHVATGDVTVNGQALSAGDGAAIESGTQLALRGAPGGEVLLFDLV